MKADGRHGTLSHTAVPYMFLAYLFLVATGSEREHNVHGTEESH